MYSVRTDLAVEAKELYKEENDKEIDGLVVDEFEEEDVKVTIVKVLDDETAEKMGKPIGNYITIDMPEFTEYDGGLMDNVANVMGKTLKKLVNYSEDKTGLIVGLGNWNVTPDALGPKVVEKIMVTRHLKTVMPDAIDDSVRPICAIAPGVLGITGIETGEIIKSLVDRIKPDFVICIDALASRRIERVNKTIQICDTGISPGAGVGNNRMKINEETVGVKVIGIGVPTVVDAVTVASDTIDLLLEGLLSKAEKGKEFYNMLKLVDKEEKNKLITEVLHPSVGGLIVTPKEIDLLMDSLSKIIANGINIAVQPNMDMEEINKFMN